MDSFDFFFPEQAEVTQLRRIAATLARSGRSQSRAVAIAKDTADDVTRLRADVNFLTMVLAAILKRLAENETLSLADVSEMLDLIDGLDGVEDTGLDPGVLCGLLGVVRRAVIEEAPPEPEVKINAEPRWRSYL